MHVKVQWDNPEQTILRYDFEENWTLTDFYEARKAGYHMVDVVPHQGYIGVLLVMPKRGVLPSNILTNVMGQMKLKHQRTLMLVLVTENQYVRVLHNALGKIYKPARDGFLRAETLDEGRKIILERLQKVKNP
jgi:hypothetical protein